MQNIIKMSKEQLRKSILRLKKTVRAYLLSRHVRAHGTKSLTFDYKSFRHSVLQFVDGLKSSSNECEYLFSHDCQAYTLYGSVYALMTLSMLGKINQLKCSESASWTNFLNSFQQSNGIFVDSAVNNEIYMNSDWWGARHLTLHTISAFTALGTRPKYPFSFLTPYYKEDYLCSWLESFDWTGSEMGDCDIDNKIMNIGCLLQYQRDWFDDAEATRAVSFLRSFLRSKINKQTGLWGGFDENNKHQRSKMAQFAYHLLTIFLYDNDSDFDWPRIVNIVINTQNRLGGYGVQPNSSACEDIDSIYILISAYPFVSKQQKLLIDRSLEKAFVWVTANQVPDGGFVFRLNEDFRYGSNQTMSNANNGAMMPTWFRTLCLLYLCHHLGIPSSFCKVRCPGYEY